MNSLAKTEDVAVIHPCLDFGGRLRVPGDKSISHRVIILSALAGGLSRVEGLLRADDCLRTLQAMESLGAESEFDGEELLITGFGNDWRVPSGQLDMGNSGTSIRLLAGLFAGLPMTVELTGDESLRARPMRRIKEPLELMGAKVELLGAGGCAPIRVVGGNLRGINYKLPVASAQVKSCLLLASLFCEGSTTVEEPGPTRDHTERLFRAAGIPVSVRGNRIKLAGYGVGGPKLSARKWSVPGDFSSAAFWLAAAAIVAGSNVTVEGVGLNERRIGFMNVLMRMGASISVSRLGSAESVEEQGNIEVAGGELEGTEIGGDEIPVIIDELPLVAAVAAAARGETVIRDARELRVKESDRISCMVSNLRALGVSADELEDGMIVRGSPVRSGRVDSFGDHRIAMAMAVLALRAEGPVTIERASCVKASYPEFWQHMRSLGADVE